MKMNKVKLGDIAEINRKTFSINDFDEILYLDTSSVTKGVFDNFISFSKNDVIPSRAKRAIKDKTIVYSTVRPNLQHFGIFENPQENIVVSTGFATIDVKDDLVNPKYLYYNLTQDNYTNALHTIATNNVSSYPSINPSDLENLELEIQKDIQTQTAIASVLSSFDDKIELNNKINKELGNLAKTIYDFWFVQNADKGWEKGKLSEIANITMGQSPDGSSYNEQGEGIVFYQGCTDFGVRFPVIRQYTTKPARFAETGDILLSVRAPVGAINFVNKKCCIGRGLAALNSKIGSITHLYFNLRNLEKIFNRSNTGGTTFGAITKDDLFSLPVTKPPRDILIQYEKIAKPIFEKQFEIEEESSTLAQLRDFLLPLLMNGQVKVNIKNE
jgi:type I restriction enzyme S subunit